MSGVSKMLSSRLLYFHSHQKTKNQTNKFKQKALIDNRSEYYNLQLLKTVSKDINSVLFESTVIPTSHSTAAQMNICYRPQQRTTNINIMVFQEAM